MERPHLPDAPGVVWRRRKGGWSAVWMARIRGFKPAGRTILRDLPDELTDEQKRTIQSTACRLQAEMLEWSGNGLRPAAFGGKVRDLCAAYRRDPDSPINKVRYRVRRNYERQLAIIEKTIGGRALDTIGGRDFRRWYETVRFPEGKDGPERIANAYSFISMLRTMIAFGHAFEVEGIRRGKISECARLAGILAELKFEAGRPRTEIMTLAQCRAIIEAAHQAGKPSIALAQALQYELALRQKDVIGEWVPISEPGVSAVAWQGEKWIRGLRWEEIDGNMILRHAMSKSRKGKMLEFDLKLYPLVMTELGRAERLSSGPMVVSEQTGRPWKQSAFMQRWRDMRKAAGVPATVWNMDSRAGATTEAIDATGGDLEAARKQAGHSDQRTTLRYSRGNLESNSKVAVLRVKARENKD